MLGYRQGPLQLHISRVGQLLLIIFIYLKVADVAFSFLNALSLTQFTLSKILSRILATGISFYFCFHVYIRHRGSVLCISLHGNNVASGSRDKSVKGSTLTACDTVLNN